MRPGQSSNTLVISFSVLSSQSRAFARPVDEADDSLAGAQKGIAVKDAAP
jgi:hypothetical protein